MERSLWRRAPRYLALGSVLFLFACELGAATPEGSKDGGSSDGGASSSDGGSSSRDAGTSSRDGGSSSSDAGSSSSDSGSSSSDGGNATSDAGSSSSDGGSGDAVKSSGCGTANAPKSGRYTINVAGTDRSYIVDVPTNYDPNKAYRLVFGWHPNGGDAQGIAESDGGYYGLKPLANNSAIFVAADGIDRGWANTNGRDIAFTKAMLDRLTGQLCIDKSRIFSLGWSYGGMFSFALGCSMGDVFRAIGPASGALLSGCAEGAHPVAMWGAHGIYDNLVNIGAGRSARDVFLDRNHCSRTTSAPDANQCVTYQGCDSGYPVVWCEWNGGHLYPEFARAETWRFFAQF